MKVLILSAATGGGHNRASNALSEYIRRNDPDAQVLIIDAISECSKLMNATITKGYHFLVTKTPNLFGKMYHVSDRESVLSDMVENINGVLAKKIVPIINEMQPDIIVSCHPFAGKMVSNLKKKYGYTFPIISIITDFMPHMAYVNDQVDAYITATDTTADALSINYDIDRRKIHPLGMPVYERFYACSDERRREIFEALELDPEKPVVLMMAGSFGVTDVLDIYERMVDTDFDYQIIVITGRNKQLYEAFEKLLGSDEEFETEDTPEFIRGLSDDNPVKLIYLNNEHFLETIKRTFKRTTTRTKPTRLFYFVDNVEDYMHVSDLIVTKPGGLTTSESLAAGLPMAIFKAFPGQEAQNASFLTQNGIAVMLSPDDDISGRITSVLSDRKRLRAMHEACAAQSPKDSCAKIYELMQEIVKESKGE